MVSKKSKQTKDNSEIISEILKPHTKGILEIVNSLRSKIKKEFSEFEERGYPVWKAIGFRDKNSGYVCGIFPFAENVRLIFEWGVLLKDPDKILLGDTKQIRYLEYFSSKEIDINVIRNFLEQSLGLPKGKKEKEMIIDSMNSTKKPVLKKRKS
ncbi:DUF1801 domain-containing protein [Leptospira selangorensis]|uniref:DUF1801 domain-containing protein n=1 Tax=Leptospira selangorensis TaxID=2484982 RepID=A0A5F2BYV7_9LEPT|nr:DUF1801 domain-containing protein [Leptospira selangorensis]TGM16062.1 DUF1801 domain-containing protein [Leptospira selangorensis]TGM17987.1 DUF1801 domain-containing protein [Leptospira selangorensis]